MKTIYYWCASAFLAAFCGGMLAGCGEAHEEDGHHHEGEGGEKTEAHAGEIVMKHAAVEAADIKFETIAAGDFQDAIKASGVIENAVGSERIISAPATGIVSFHTGVVSGSAVQAGQSLFSISSKGLEQSDANAGLRTDLELAEKELRRAEELVKENLISQREYDRIRADRDRAAAALATVGARTGHAIGVSTPIGGYLVSVDVSPGSFVNMGDRMAVVATNRRVLLRADVSERYRSQAASIAGANILAAGTDKVYVLADYGARVLSHGASSSAGSHYFPIYIEFDNPGGLGRGSVVEVWLLGQKRSGVISVPKSALVEEGGYYYVYVRQNEEEAEHEHEHEGEHEHDHDADHDHDGHEHGDHEHGDHMAFKKVEVKIGATDGSRVEILSGLKPGDVIASQGALKIRMAGMGSSIQGHSHHH